MNDMGQQGAEQQYPPATGQPAGHADTQERMWAMWCHLAGLGGLLVPLGSVLGPLAVWLTKRQEFRLVDEEGKKALNFQITAVIFYIVFVVALIASVASELLVIAIAVGIAGLAFAITWLVSVIMAAVRTNEGKDFRYPMSIRFLK